MVRASADEFTFATETASVSVAPVVWYNSAGQVYAFGLDHALSSEFRRVDLFPRERPAASADSLIAPLEQFLRYHVELVARSSASWWKSVLRQSPDVVFTEVRDFQGRVNGNPRALLTHAAQNAGVRRVEFL